MRDDPNNGCEGDCHTRALFCSCEINLLSCLPYLNTMKALWCPFAAQKSWDTLLHDDEMIAIKQHKNRYQKNKKWRKTICCRGEGEGEGSPLGFVADMGEG